MLLQLVFSFPKIAKLFTARVLKLPTVDFLGNYTYYS